MKTIRFFSLAFASILMMGGCATVKVVTDIKSGTDFSNYRTFKVVHFVNEEVQQTQNFRVNQINRERIEQAIAINAEQRGMKKAESDPDVVLLWATDVNIEESYSSHTT
jgi:hypothetical protein